MSWVRKDDQMPIHRKVAPLSDAAYRLLDEAICWSNRNLTDGAIGCDDLEQISKRGKPKLAAELVGRRLWHTAGSECPSEKCPPAGPDGWVIHDYWDYQPTRVQVERDRAAKASRQARWRAKRAGVSSEKVDPVEIYERDGWICQLCNGPVDRTARGNAPKAPVLDHIKPEALGGTYTYDNLQTAHHRCNSQKRHSYNGDSNAGNDAHVDALLTPAPSPTPPRPEGRRGGSPAVTAARRMAASAGDGGREDQTPPARPPSSRRLSGSPDFDAIARAAVRGQRRGSRAAEVRAEIRRPTLPAGRDGRAFDELRLLTTPPDAAIPPEGAP